MSITRFSVGRLMAVVGVVALNLAAALRLAAYDDKYDDELMPVVMPAALVLQVALSRLISTRARKRAFWAGLLAAGLCYLDVVVRHLPNRPPDRPWGAASLVFILALTNLLVLGILGCIRRGGARGGWASMAIATTRPRFERSI